MSAMKPDCDTQSPSTSQLGAVAESVILTRLMTSSRGRLSCFRPVVDIDGIDVMVMDRETHRTLGLQVKSWTYQDDRRPRTVQFDVGVGSWKPSPRLYVLSIVLDGASLQPEACWLTPAADVPAVSTLRNGRMRMRPNPRPGSRDQYARYRRPHFEAVATELLGALQ